MPHLFDQLKGPPPGRALNPGAVSNHAAAAGHAVKRAEREVKAAREAAAKGGDAQFAERELAQAEDRLRGVVGERNMALRTIVDRVSRGDTILTSPVALTLDQRIAAERRSDDARTRTPPA